MTVKLNLIAAACENMGIGKNNNLPWRLKTEMAYFTKMTSKTKDKRKRNVVIMGRKTWDSLPKQYKPLPGRINVVLSRSDLDLKTYPDTYSFKSLDECINKLNNKEFQKVYESTWVVGGSQIYKEAMSSIYFHRLYLTRILKTYDCDTFFPELPPSLKKINDPDVPTVVQSENDIEFIYDVYLNEAFTD